MPTASAELCARRFVLSEEVGSVQPALMMALATLAAEAAPGALSPWITELVAGAVEDEEFAVSADPSVWVDIASTQPPADAAAQSA